MDFLVRLREIRRLLRQDRRDRVRRGVPPECPLPRQHLVEDRPEGEEIGSPVCRFPPHLFGRHVPHRPQDDPGLGLRDGLQVRLPAGAGLRLQLGEAEVQDLDAAVLGQEKPPRPGRESCPGNSVVGR